MIELDRIAPEARCKQKHEPGHGDLGEDGEGDQHKSEAGQGLPGKAPRRPRR